LRSSTASRVRKSKGAVVRHPGASLTLALLLSCGLGAGSALAEDPQEDGCRAAPSIGCVFGDHHVDLSVSTRLRTEFWDARAGDTDTFYAARTRIGLKYSFRDLVTLFGEFQDARIYSLSPSSSGAGGLYRTFADGRSRTHSDRLRQLWLEVRPLEGLGIRIGRQDIKLGTEAMYPEGNWKYLKIQRASQRLVGTVGWTHGERSNDGISVAYDTGNGHHIYGFAARPTTGVFDIEDAYHRQDDINYGGVSWTVKRDTWIPNTELRLFGLAYDDDRSARHGGRPDQVEVYTLGFSTIGVFPVGPGNVDVLVWGAYQFGDFTPPGRLNDLDHNAAAGIFEVGYQFTEVPTKPWFRMGVNVASGDGDPNDSDHNTFFNMLPTNHLYYGFADQWAFQNLIDWFAQLMLKPHEKVGVNLTLHRFSLQNDDDFRYFGTGAYTRSNFGYGAQPSRGYRSGGTEIDAVVNYDVNQHLSVQGGYAYMWGHGIFNNFRDENVSFGYLQVALKY
jgi:hypothetical protein